MTRLLALFLLWLATAVANASPWSGNCLQAITAGQTLAGQITSNDCAWHFANTPNDVQYTDVYTFSGTAGQQIAVTMSSPVLDTYLEIYNVNEVTANPLVSNDDGGGGTNSRIPAGSGYYTLPATGTYYIWAGTALPNATGLYTLTLSTPSGPPASGEITVTEFYHPQFNHYFITAYPEEAASLAAGNLPPWVPTGQTFKVWSAAGSGITNVCRFFSATFAPRSSHFYSGNPAECPGLAAGGVWTLESSNAFYMMPTATGVCPSGTIPLYRLYNNGMSGAPNHRYTVHASVRQTMLQAGWIPEGNGPDGVFACVPPTTAPPPPTGSAFQQEVTGYANTILGLVSGDVVDTDQLTLILTSALTALTTPGSTCPAATSTPPLQGLEAFPPNLTINVSYGAGCAVQPGTTVAGSMVLSITNLVVTDTAVSGGITATFNNVTINGALVANGSVQATFAITANSSLGTFSGPITVTLNNLQLPNGIGFSGTATINLNSAGTTILTTNLTSSPHNLAIRLNLSIIAQSDDSVLISSAGANTVGAYALQVNNLRVDTAICANGPFGGSLSFSQGGQTGTLTFNSNCSYTYSGP